MDKVGRDEGRNYRNALLETQQPSVNVVFWEGQFWTVGNPATVSDEVERSMVLSRHQLNELCT